MSGAGVSKGGSGNLEDEPDTRARRRGYHQSGR